MTSDWLLLAVSLAVVVVAVAGVVTTVLTERRVSELEQLVYTLAQQSEDQATLINQQAQLILQITTELRR